MATEYILARLTQNKKSILCSESFSDKKLALANYQTVCENNPRDHFKVVMRETVEKTIAESDDYRQAIFGFAN